MKLEELIKQHYSQLTENERYIWSFIVHHKPDCEKYSIQKLAQVCNVSTSAILRFVRKLEFQGYSEFKYYLKWDIKNDSSFGVNQVDLSCEQLIDTITYMKKQDFTKLFQMMEQAGRIFVYSTGEVQKNAAKEIKRCFTAANLLIHTLEGIEETRIIVNQLLPDDLFLMLSLSGENKVMNQFVEILKKKSIKIVSITGFAHSYLEKHSDFHIFFMTHEVQTQIKNHKVYMMTHYFLITELLFLRYLEYLG